MKFLLDEDVPIELAHCLRAKGHAVESVWETLGARTPDDDIWRHAVHMGAILITCNRDDFLELAGTDPQTGLVILNRRCTRPAECNHVLRLLANAVESGLSRNINFA